MWKRIASIIVLALLLVACGELKSARNIGLLDDRLGRLHQAAEDNPANAFAFYGSYFEIAETAYKATDGEKDQRSKVSLYRIAAVAMWKAGEQSTTKINEYLDAGKAACEALEGGAESQPRDCALINLVLPFAIFDERKREYALLRDEADKDQLGMLRLETDQETQVAAIATDMLKQAKNIVALQGTYEKWPLPPAFHAYANRQVRLALCTINVIATSNALGVIATQFEGAKTLFKNQISVELSPSNCPS